MPVPARISIITLGVRDVARSTAFYESFGWKRSSASQEGEVSFFMTADSVLGLFGHGDLAEDVGSPASEPPPFRGITLAINLESEAEVRRVLEEAAGAGGTILKPAQSTSWGGYHGYFGDPDGHAWEVAHNPFFPFTPDGSLDLPE